MKNKKIFLLVLISFLTYQCSVSPLPISFIGDTPLVGIIGLFGSLNNSSDDDSDDSSSGYYFKEYNKSSNDGNKAFDTIRSMTTEIRAAVVTDSSKKGLSNVCKGVNLATAVNGVSPEDTIKFLYNSKTIFGVDTTAKKLKELVPGGNQATDQPQLVEALITAAIAASGTTTFQELKRGGDGSSADRRTAPMKTEGDANIANGFVAQIYRSYDKTGKKWPNYEPNSNQYHCYLATKEGLEYVQFVEKGLFSLPYYQAMKILDGIKNQANTKDGKKANEKDVYTNREKEWDKLFGYFGAPVDYSISNYDKGYLSGRTGLFNSYGISRSRRVEAKDVTGETSIRNFADDLMNNGFIKGREEISAHEKADEHLDAAVKVVSLRFKHAIILGGLSYAYFGHRSLKAKGADDEENQRVAIGQDTAVNVVHVLSEAAGMFWALGVADKALGNSSNKSKFTESDINFILQKLTGDTTINTSNVAEGKGNFYSVTAASIKEARERIVAKYPEFASSYVMD